MMRFYDFIMNNLDDYYKNRADIVNAIDNAYVDLVDGINIIVQGLIGRDNVTYNKIVNGVHNTMFGMTKSANHYENIVFNVTYDGKMYTIEAEIKFD